MKKNGFLYKKIKNSKCVLVAFSSFYLDRHKDQKFDFYSLTYQDEFSVVLVSDLENIWYHNINEPEGFWRPSTFDKLKNIVKSYDRKIFIGSSMGGYAAILFGSLLDASHIISFSPQTMIDPEAMLQIGDDRLHHILKGIKTHAGKAYKPDLVPFVKKYIEKGFITIFLSESEDKDHAQAERIEDERVNIIYIPKLKHNLVSPLNASGVMRKIINNYIYSDSEFNDFSLLDNYIDSRDHNLYSSGSVELSAQKDNISFNFILENISKEIWDHSSGKFTKIFISVRNEHGIADLHYALDFDYSTLNPGDYINKTIKIELGELKFGNYSFILSMGDHKINYDDIGYTPIIFNLSILRDTKINSYEDKRCNMIMNREDDGYKYSMSSINTIDFPVSSGLIKTDCGIIYGDILEMRFGDVGFGAFGPYYALQSGRYLLEMYFEPGSAVGSATFDVVSEKGSHFNGEYDLKGSESVVKYFFEINEDINKFESRIYSDGNFKCKLRGVRLHILNKSEYFS